MFKFLILRWFQNLVQIFKTFSETSPVQTLVIFLYIIISLAHLSLFILSYIQLARVAIIVKDDWTKLPGGS